MILGLVNNVYAGTENYKKVHDRATYFGNWERQTSTVIQKNPRIRYIRVVEVEPYFVPNSLEGLSTTNSSRYYRYYRYFRYYRYYIFLYSWRNSN